VFIGRIEVKLMGEPPVKHLELIELEEFDNKLLRKSNAIEERKMPEIPVWSTKTDKIRENKEKEMELTADLL
jgi:hypothetical protein